MCSIPGSDRYAEGGHGNPLQSSCLKNPMGRGAWWAIVLRVTKSQTRLKRHSMHRRVQALHKYLKKNNGKFPSRLDGI